MTIKKDGSGELNITYSIDQDLYQELLDIQSFERKSSDLHFFDEEKIKSQFEKLSSIDDYSARVYKSSGQISAITFILWS